MGYEFWAGDNIVYTKNDNLVSIWTQILKKKPQHVDMRCLRLLIKQEVYCYSC